MTARVRAQLRRAGVWRITGEALALMGLLIVIGLLVHGVLGAMAETQAILEARR